MYRTIVVGTDFSDGAARAVDQAAAVARAFEAKIHIVSAYRSPLTAGVVPSSLDGMVYGGVEHLQEAETKIAEDLERRVTELVGTISDGVQAEGHWRSGDAADVLIGLAEELGADLLVVGNRGLGAVKRFVLGSVSARVVNHAPCSVLVVHDG